MPYTYNYSHGSRITLHRQSPYITRNDVTMSTATATSMWGIYNARYAPGTSKQYAKAYGRFRQWCMEHHIDIDAEAVKQQHHIDNILSVYLTELYLHNDKMGSSGKTEAVHTVFGLLHFQTHLQKSTLRKALGILDGWGRLKPSISTPPMSFKITVAVAVAMARSGYTEAAIATLVAWDCYLRVSEYCNLQVKDVIPSHDTRIDVSSSSHNTSSSAPSTIITLPHSKTGTHQSVAIRNPQIDALLTAYLQHSNKPPNSKLFPFSASEYTEILHQATYALGMQHIHFTPHSLRRGGATGQFMEMGEAALQQIMLRGRWLSFNSIRTYIQMAPSIVAEHSIPASTLDIGSRYQDQLLSQLLPYVTHSTNTQ